MELKYMFIVNYKIEKRSLNCFITSVAKSRVRNDVTHDTVENEKLKSQPLRLFFI